VIGLDMSSDAETLYNEISRFIDGSSAGLLQVLVAAAQRTTFERIIACPTYPVPAKISGLSATVQRLREALVLPDVHVPTFLARLYESARPLKERKQAGQFFTSADVAEWALSIVAPLQKDDVCDAGAGTGVFADAILRRDQSVGSYVGVENDPILALCIAHTLESINAPDTYKVWYANFLLLQDAAFEERELRVPTFIISNPPFVRVHNLKGRERIRATLKLSLGVTLPSLSGASSYFLLRAAELAGSSDPSTSNRPRGHLLFFLPKEAEGGVHAQLLREDLERLHGWTHRIYKIPYTHTGIDQHRSNAVGLFFVFEHTRLHAELTKPPSKPAVCVKDLIKIRRGISTGCNEFFVLTDEKALQSKIPKRYLQRVLPTRIPIQGKNFSEADWDLLRKSGYPCWLLTLPNRKLEDFEAPVQEYLKEGLRRGLHMTPTARELRTWFSIRVLPAPPDVFVTYFFHDAPRFILNGAGALNLTNILGGRFVHPIKDPELKDLLIDLLNEQAKSWIKENMAGREYKSGLRRIEPRALSMLPVNSTIVELVNSERQLVTAKSQSLFD
jgi:adenine-specific DNA-methyltransferase